MTEKREGGSPLLLVGLLLAAAFAGVLIFAMWEMGAGHLRTLALIFVGALALGIVLVASAVPIRAWRKKDPTGETFHVTDGTRTIVKEVRTLDGRAPMQNDIKLLQLPAQPQGGAFPDLLRAAYQAGQRGLPGGLQLPGGANGYVERELPEIDPDDPVGWDGDITS